MKQSLHSLLRKCVFLSVVTLSMHSVSYSQDELRNTTEFGFTTGPMVVLSDLGGHAGKGTTFIKDYNMNRTKLAFGIYYAVYPAQWLGFRFSGTYGSIQSSDADITSHGGDEDSRKARNLDFRSKIIEGTAMVEFYPTVFLEDGSDDVAGRLRPYGVLGLGLYHFNPQGTYRSPGGDSYWVDLRPLHTEGEGWAEYPDRKEYSLTQLNIPMGAGIKYFFSENVNISFEIIHRKLFTDYLDDVSKTYVDPTLFAKYLSPSQAAMALYMSNKAAGGYSNPNYTKNSKRGDPGNNDSYFTAGFKIGIRIGGGKEDRWRNSTHCPLLRF